MLTERRKIVVGDLILMEVLQCTRSDRDAARTLERLTLFDYLPIASRETVIRAAAHYRTLRVMGITIRRTIDTLIATRCILDHIPLLYADRDFDPFVEHLGLRSALHKPGVT